MSDAVAPSAWYEAVRYADGVTRIDEPWLGDFFRANIWHVRGRDRDLLLDSGSGLVSLSAQFPEIASRAPLAVASHTHFDHIGCHHEFAERAVHPLEAETLANPTNAATLAEGNVSAAMAERWPEGHAGWRAYSIPPAPATRLLEEGDVVDLGDRAFEVLHTPGHSPGGISLFERRAGMLLSGDALYDGGLIDDFEHSDVEAYCATMETLRRLPVQVVHPGHGASFGPLRHRRIIDAYLAEKGR